MNSLLAHSDSRDPRVRGFWSNPTDILVPEEEYTNILTIPEHINAGEYVKVFVSATIGKCNAELGLVRAETTLLPVT